MGWCVDNVTSASSETPPPADAVTIAVLDILLVTSSIVLNVLILLAVLRNQRLHTVSNVFISSLAASNLFLAIVTDIKMIIMLISCYKPVLDTLTDCIYAFVYSLSMTTSAYNHLMIASERWLYIAKPFLHHRVITYRSTLCGVILSWVVAFFCSVNLISGPCAPTFFESRSKINYCLVIPVIHFILSTFMIIIYGHIALITRNQTRAIKKTTSMNTEHSKRELDPILSNLKSTWKQVRMLVIVFGVYFVLTTPYIVTNVYVYVHEISLVLYNDNIGKAVTLISHAQCGANFLTYCLQDRDFRHVLRQYCLKFKISSFSGRVNPIASVT
ncbi:unnamed protein product [Candidula unifasciata]|uniref:G-protein coupled receptors family 1 profile domain-containing protein n=1 Tax=Candidula unifasciata TaxID=100452 RepID=A0A8S3ZVX8_9EUPU|nr:unnamed protein product [Candidula unifasciata]